MKAGYQGKGYKKPAVKEEVQQLVLNYCLYFSKAIKLSKRTVEIVFEQGKVKNNERGKIQWKTLFFKMMVFRKT